ncbi:substrate-binding domain-containing protein [Frankia sp. Cpl3]|nr:substrate-binding domain-containing protein [Parafrankia colletiae]MCK9904405.1 substrate-binding domain-containing protein [Frankia sp. Cpl3]
MLRPSAIRLAGAFTAAGLVLAGCSSAAGSEGASPTSAPTLSASLTKAMAPTADSAYKDPGPAVTGVSSLAGKTVWYIPLSSQITTTQLVQTSLAEALGTAHIDVHACSGDANPSTIAGCITSAINGKAAGVVFDSIVAGFVAEGIRQLKAAHIPVVIANEPNPDGDSPGDASLAYVPGNPMQALQVLAQWIAEDSHGKAAVLINEVTDAPPPIAYVQNGFIPALKSACSSCTVTVNKIQSANYSLIPSSTSAALISNPTTDYVVSEFDAFAAPTQQGVQQTGKLNAVKGASAGGLLAQLQTLKSGTFLRADVGTNFAYQGWAMADQLLRLLTGAAPITYQVPLRLFTAANIGSLDLTNQAQISGDWYGSTAYKQMFTRLWGLGN